MQKYFLTLAFLLVLVSCVEERKVDISEVFKDHGIETKAVRETEDELFITESFLYTGDPMLPFTTAEDTVGPQFRVRLFEYFEYDKIQPDTLKMLEIRGRWYIYEEILERKINHRIYSYRLKEKEEE